MTKARLRLTPEPRRRLRVQQTKHLSKYTVGGVLKKKQPAPITLRRFDGAKP